MFKRIVILPLILLISVLWIQNIYAGCSGEYRAKINSNAPDCLKITGNECLESVDIENYCDKDFKIFGLENCKVKEKYEKDEFESFLHEKFIDFPRKSSIYFNYPKKLIMPDEFKLNYCHNRGLSQAEIICNSENIRRKDFNFTLEDENGNVYNVDGIYEYEKIKSTNTKTIIREDIIASALTLALTFIFMSIGLYNTFKVIKLFIKKK